MGHIVHFHVLKSLIFLYLYLSSYFVVLLVPPPIFCSSFPCLLISIHDSPESTTTVMVARLCSSISVFLSTFTSCHPIARKIFFFYWNHDFVNLNYCIPLIIIFMLTLAQICCSVGVYSIWLLSFWHAHVILWEFLSFWHRVQVPFVLFMPMVLESAISLRNLVLVEDYISKPKSGPRIKHINRM